jgi:hypothetical protein
MRVSVYFNLHRKLFSLRAEEGPSKGKVIGHAREVTLDGVAFHVGKAGQAKVRETGKKNVHAFVRGDCSAVFDFEATDAGREAMLPWNMSKRHSVPTSGAYRPARLRADHTAKTGTPVVYNPYKLDTFETRDGAPIHRADMVHLAGPREVYARTIPQ